MANLALCGVGRMGRALLDGWVKANADFHFTLFEPHADQALIEFASTNKLELNPPKITAPFDIVFMAVKPQMFAQIMASDFARAIDPQTLVISVMAGISLENMAAKTNALRIIRAMPNTPGQIGQGITAFVGNENCTAQDHGLALQTLSPLGEVVALTDEAQIDAVTAVSGSGPAYLFLLIEALTNAAIAQGLSPELATKLARQTIIGSANLMAQSGKSAENLRVEVTSPKGTTEAALEVLLAKNGLESLLQKAVDAATKRSIELGKS
ncbi:MAG: pyrroline-5-carboxylate reductase [Hyphomonadaceae bacterium]|nr:MAG: pyrroline-5-carboxylate reductase [Hyphomonadaceae bacterium]